MRYAVYLWYQKICKLFYLHTLYREVALMCVFLYGFNEKHNKLNKCKKHIFRSVNIEINVWIGFGDSHYLIFNIFKIVRYNTNIYYVVIGYAKSVLIIN